MRADVTIREIIQHEHPVHHPGSSSTPPHTHTHTHTHLREELLEVLEGQLGPLADGGQRGVIPHGAQRLVGSLGHGDQEHLEGLAGVPAKGACV